MIQQGWREQYDRMKRSYVHFIAVASGETAAGSDVARDALFHFFQDAYHLKDWLKDDRAVGVDGAAIERVVTDSRHLTACADLCNGTKHRSLTRPREKGGPGASFATQSVHVHVPAVGGSTTIASVGPAGSELAPGASLSVDAASVRGPTGFTTHRWTVRTNWGDIDAEELARLVVREWDDWLGQHGLLPPA